MTTAKLTQPSSWGTIRKAVAAAVGTGLTTVAGAIGASLADGKLTLPEVGIAVGAGLVAAAAVGRTVWKVPNS